jgi:hypothetical protein
MRDATPQKREPQKEEGGYSRSSFIRCIIKFELSHDPQPEAVAAIISKSRIVMAHAP